MLGVALAAMWLVLNDTVAPGQVLLGALIATGLILWAAKLRPLRPRLYRPWLAISLLTIVFVDIVRSNIWKATSMPMVKVGPVSLVLFRLPFMTM